MSIEGPGNNKKMPVAGNNSLREQMKKIRESLEIKDSSNSLSDQEQKRLMDYLEKDLKNNSDGNANKDVVKIDKEEIIAPQYRRGKKNSYFLNSKKELEGYNLKTSEDLNDTGVSEQAILNNDQEKNNQNNNPSSNNMGSEVLNVSNTEALGENIKFKEWPKTPDPIRLESKMENEENDDNQSENNFNNESQEDEEEKKIWKGIKKFFKEGNEEAEKELRSYKTKRVKKKLQSKEKREKIWLRTKDLLRAGPEALSSLPNATAKFIGSIPARSKEISLKIWDNKWAIAGAGVAGYGLFWLLKTLAGPYLWYKLVFKSEWDKANRKG